MLSEEKCIQFLQWALPRLHMRWRGFRRVHGQVCKRLRRRLAELHMDSVDRYVDYLERVPSEWSRLDQLCRISISRFYRDTMVCRQIGEHVLPTIAHGVFDQAEAPCIRVWSAGCASGEEPYTVKLIWECELAMEYPDISLQILATDIDESLLHRAQVACYPFSSIKHVPVTWRQQAFGRQNDEYCLAEQYRHGVEFRLHDIRAPLEAESFHLVLCRNLAFTYYDAALQQRVLDTIYERLLPGGYLIVGTHEQIENSQSRFSVESGQFGIYRKTG